MSQIHYIFIDYENVPETGLERIAGKPVKVVLVRGQQQKKLLWDLTDIIHKHASQFRLVKTEVIGRNALDFVLAYEVGAEAERDPKGCFNIVSRDTGFDALVTHLTSRGLSAARCASLNEVRVLVSGNKQLMSRSERLKQYAAQLRTNAANRPKTRKTLESQIQSWFGKALSAKELEDAIRGFIAEKLLTISDQGAVTYKA